MPRSRHDVALTRPPTPSYSASDPGFAAVAVEDLLAGEADLIARIKLCYGSDRDTFERDLLRLMRRYAACVHLLPATADNYFSAPGGLLRLGLEAAFFSLQGTDAHIFSGRMSISARRRLEPRWRHATFIAGLCCELHRVMSHVIVTDPAGEAWPAFLQPLAEWLAQPGRDRYFVRWRPQVVEARGLGLFALPHVVPAAVLADLAEDNSVIVPHLLASIGGIPIYPDHNVLDELVRRSLALVIDRNLAASADRYGSPQYGSHLERYLVDALRRLASGNSAWVPNRERSRLWLGLDGLFLIWPGAAEDLQHLLEADRLAGIPKAPETMLELLLAAGVFEAAAEGRSTWSIQPPGTKIPLEAVKLSAPAILLAGVDPPPVALPRTLEFRPTRAPSPAAAAICVPAPAAAAPRSGTQLSLIPPEEDSGNDPNEAPVTETVGPSQPASTLSPPRTTIALQAPMRLNTAVRDALTEALSTLNDGMAPPAVCTVAQGVFVPLEEFGRRGIQPPLALRALTEADMLVKQGSNGAPTLCREFNGSPTVGIVLRPRHVAGIDLAAFAAPLERER